MNKASSYKRKSMGALLTVAATFVVLELTANLCLSVTGLKCHQCNSHLDEDCNTLRLSTPHSPRDDHYLRECELRAGEVVFCRKTAITIDVTHEQRVIRSCGWLSEEDNKLQNECFNADSDGYKQIICSCDTNGCNAATTQFGSAVSQATLIAFTGACILLASVLRQSA